ncbi:hypothetical protein [Nocardia stercoris]|uniref:CMD domain protein n=1 Tax=Nocardia stercoris TaxID=2483361 RepID=A0A3M2LDL6_9NOCA|nr:hypothetical protein [Nocardia stercoris]RMI35611.1 hypothetical protein EBN03_05090 [Nocardia stercoris]
MSDTDVIESVLGDRAATVRDLRAARPAVATHTQEVFEALFTGSAADGLGPQRLTAVAAAVAELAGAPDLAAFYRRQAAAPVSGDPVLAVLLRHALLVTTQPSAATRVDIDALTAAGLSTADIVTLSQLIGYVNYQVRLLAGLTLIGASHD